MRKQLSKVAFVPSAQWKYSRGILASHFVQSRRISRCNSRRYVRAHTTGKKQTVDSSRDANCGYKTVEKEKRREERRISVSCLMIFAARPTFLIVVPIVKPPFRRACAMIECCEQNSSRSAQTMKNVAREANDENVLRMLFCSAVFFHRLWRHLERV